MMTEQVRKMLEEKEHPENIQDLLEYLNELLKQSRGDMGKHYERWDKNLEVYKGYKYQSPRDREAEIMDEPQSFITPLGFAQVQTFVSFAFLLLMQNKHLFELEPTGDEDFKLRDVIEKTLERDLRHNTFPVKLYQFLLDLARFDIGVLKSFWKVDKQWVEFMPKPPTAAPTTTSIVLPSPPLPVSQEVIKYEGNAIVNVDPYHFLPDTRLPITRWAEGEFAADESEWNISTLRDWESQEQAAGVEHILPMDTQTWEERGPTRLPVLKKIIETTSRTKGKKNKKNEDFMVCVTEVQVYLTPKKYEIGTEAQPILHNVRIANDNRIISIEKSPYIHGDFCYDVAMFSPDMHVGLEMSLMDTISALQDVITWLINSRIVSVRRSLENHLVVDPSAVDMSDVEARHRVIKLRKGVPRMGMDKFIKQLDILDTTQKNFEDADALMKIMFMVTGVNENMFGQVFQGRRSATENRNASAGAASRMKVITTNAFLGAISPMGKKMMINQRYEMSPETFEKIVGKNPEELALYSEFHPDDPTQLIGNEDFFVFDATLSSEKGFVAQSLQELLIALIGNPQVLAALNLDVGEMIYEIQALRGVTNIKRFQLPPPAAEGVPGTQLNPANQIAAGGPTLPAEQAGTDLAGGGGGGY